MEELKEKKEFEGEREMIYSQAIRAGKRIYYLDVKKNRKEELFLSITESKKIVSGDGGEAQYSFEKHKIFLYQEDFSKFIEGLSKAIRFIHENQQDNSGEKLENQDVKTSEESLPDKALQDEIKIDIDF